jgi:hypothetical protein
MTIIMKLMMIIELNSELFTCKLNSPKADYKVTIK